MIIKKRRFNLTPGYRGKWPFTVPEVAIQVWRVGDNDCFAVIHNFGAFALSGALESHGFARLDDAGIWLYDIKHGAKKSLSPLFKYLAGLVAVAGVKEGGEDD